jgi:ribonuclease HII
MTTAFEARYWNEFSFIAGVDEAGRGPLAGPVVAAAAIFDKGFQPSRLLKKVDDSKALSAELREELAEAIKHTALAFAIAEAGPETIDRINILQATFLSMNRAIEQLSTTPDFLLIDGNRFKSTRPIPFETVVKGDAKVFSIAAASILAKTHRDAVMMRLDKDFPNYGFAEHFGYPTPSHIAAIRQHGRSAIHRLTFKLKALGEKSEQSR